MDKHMAFKQAMSKAGIEPPAEIIADSVLHRFHVSGDKPDSANGWYVFHDGDLAAAAFGCWKRGVSETWSGRDYRSLTVEEKALHTAHLDRIRRQRDEEQARIQAKCRASCAEIWRQAKDATSETPYLKSKGINSYGLKAFENSLIVPVQDIAGTIHGLQFIATNGSKKFKTGTSKIGHFFKIGRSKDQTVIVCEGYATGASIHQATGHAVVIAFDAGNLLPVAKEIRSKCPGMQIIIAADNDQWTAGNPGLTRAREAADKTGSILVAPSFHNIATNPTDFNDLHKLEGVEAVRHCIEDAVKPQTPGLIRLDTVSPRKVEWLWPGYIPRGKFTLIDGDPGLGKSLVTIDLIARCSSLGLMPDGSLGLQGGAVLLALEDGLADTIVPRLEAAGGNKAKVLALQGVPDGSENLRLPTVEDVEIIANACDEVDAMLVVIDPVMGYLGSVNSWKDQDIRRALAPLVGMAEAKNVAVVGIRHLNKGTSSQSMYRGGGSIGFIGLARVGLLIAKDPENDSTRILAGIKSNLAPLPPSLSYSIENCKGIPKIVWGGISGHTADALLAIPATLEERSALDEAKDFLADILSRGPVNANEIIKQAKQAGISDRTLKRAKKALSISSEKLHFSGNWTWRIPSEEGQEIPKGVNKNDGSLGAIMAPFAKEPHLSVATEEIIEGTRA